MSPVTAPTTSTDTEIIEFEHHADLPLLQVGMNTDGAEISGVLVEGYARIGADDDAVDLHHNRLIVSPQRPHFLGGSTQGASDSYRCGQEGCD